MSTGSRSTRRSRACRSRGRASSAPTPEKLNPWGGAIAHGHPLGATGAGPDGQDARGARGDRGHDRAADDVHRSRHGDRDDHRANLIQRKRRANRMDLKTKSTFIVTGGASGLGAGTVRTLARGRGQRRHRRPAGGQGRGAGQGARREGAVREVRRHERSRRQGGGRAGGQDLRRPAGPGELRRHRDRREDDRQGRPARARRPSPR